MFYLYSIALQRDIAIIYIKEIDSLSFIALYVWIFLLNYSGCGVSANEYSCTSKSPNELWRSYSMI